MTDGLEKDIRDYLQNMTTELIEVKDKVSEMHCAVAVLTVEVGTACKRLDDVCGDIYGNGKDGLKSEVHEHLVRHDERGKLWKAAAAIGGASGISGLLTAIFK